MCCGHTNGIAAFRSDYCCTIYMHTAVPVIFGQSDTLMYTSIYILIAPSHVSYTASRYVYVTLPAFICMYCCCVASCLLSLRILWVQEEFVFILELLCTWCTACRRRVKSVSTMLRSWRTINRYLLCVLPCTHDVSQSDCSFVVAPTNCSRLFLPRMHAERLQPRTACPRLVPVTDAPLRKKSVRGHK